MTQAPTAPAPGARPSRLELAVGFGGIGMVMRDRFLPLADRAHAAAGHENQDWWATLDSNQ